MANSELFRHTETADPFEASVRIDPGTRAETPVEPRLFGKFCEHLGNNIYHGMDAQILFNPTFGEWHFRAHERRPSGGFVSENDRERIHEEIEDHGRPLAYPPETDPDALIEAYEDALAFGWQPEGVVTPSPDTGPNGNRAQRVELPNADTGVFQATRLPLDRVHDYEFRTQLRATEPTTVTLVIRRGNDSKREGSDREDDILAEASIAVTEEWEITEGDLSLPDDIEEDAVYEIVLTGTEAANLLVERVLLYPDDHVNYADPDVVAFLRESDLPLLRWPGGNFVSGYDWRDGVGPKEERPERINPAWSGLEPNLFGTNEFMDFCEAVGCEPSICVNAGDGTPAEAAAWVEYCNGSTDTEMGALRAEHGHPEPYDVTFWEIGNEIYGKWQVNWTTANGNADRYDRFREAMLDVDPDILVSATGLETNSDGSWNDTLLERAGTDVRAISDHILAGGQVSPDTDPDELYEAFMGFSEQLGETYANLRSRMERAGIADPKLDVTELQLFASFQDNAEGEGRNTANETDTSTAQLTPATMPTPETISEALYDATIRHEFIRLGSFVELLTHSATVNHGGGLWKEGERVWANPCHYGRTMGMALAGGTPIAIDIECDTISTEQSFREIDPVDGVPAVDAFAVDHGDELVVMLVNRTSRDDAIPMDLAFDGVADGEAEVVTLAGESMHDANTRAEPERVTPDTRSVVLEDGRTTLDLAPYSMVRVTVPRGP